jgi:hypothetical protein
MMVATATNTLTNNASALGKVLAVSPDSSTVLTATSGTVFAFTTSNSSVKGFPVTNASAAAFSPDNNRAYIATPSGIVVYTSATGAVSNLNIGAVNSVDFLSQGAFAYLVGDGNNVTVLATCNNSVPATGAVTPQPTSQPTLIRSLPDATRVLAVESSTIDDINVGAVGSTAPSGSGTGCTPPTVTATPPAALPNTNTPVSFSVAGTFTPTQLLVTPDSTKAFILASNNSNLVGYDIAGHTPTSKDLGGNLTTGGVTLDGDFVFVGVTGTNTVHKIAMTNGALTDAITPVQLSFQPDLVAVRPK